MFENTKMMDSVIIKKFPYGNVKASTPTEVINHMKTVSDVCYMEFCPIHFLYSGASYTGSPFCQNVR